MQGNAGNMQCRIGTYREMQENHGFREIIRFRIFCSPGIPARKSLTANIGFNASDDKGFGSNRISYITEFRISPLKNGCREARGRFSLGQGFGEALQSYLGSWFSLLGIMVFLTWDHVQSYLGTCGCHRNSCGTRVCKIYMKCLYEVSI
jgi:hypothetical protein